MMDGSAPGCGGLLVDYGTVPLDEAIDPSGEIRQPYRRVLEALGDLGSGGLSGRSEELQTRRRENGVVFTANVDGRPTEQVFPLDPVPRLIGADSWRHLEAGAAQRARALNAFLADVYSSVAGPSSASIVAAGVIPEQVIAGVPGHRPQAASLVPGGHQRATVLGLDLLTDSSGEWVVLEDNLQVPSGLGYVLANRRTAAACFPELHREAQGLRSPEVIGALLHRAMADAAPPRCVRSEPQVVVLSDGPVNSAWYEHRTLAAEMGVPVVHPEDLRADGDGVVAVVDGRSVPVDVVYRRLGGDELLGDDRAAVLLRRAAAAGTVSIVNAPGNGIADDKAIYAFVAPMIRHYLDEEPILRDVGTWVLADPEQYRAVRGRMGDLVVKPVDGSGGDGVMIGPELTRAQVADLEERVAAAPHRYIAQDVIRFSTHPTFTGVDLRPRHVDLRIFVLSGAETVVVPAGLTRVAMGADGLLVNSSQGGGSKDTWLSA
ncbi:carboxylate-amine ligase [Nakamurella sp. UYEF19]|uniref:circularly permuted type 2 ATP-grasp protein n=1 Tax=Nakamurella sp. UYEF19 TaxID=1756392 RepID=UPI0033916F19